VQVGDVMGRYTLMSRLDSGGQGAVFLACDERGFQYALKLLHGDARRSIKEVEAAQAVRSPHVARIWDHDLTAEIPYIAYAAVPGHTLTEVLTRRDPTLGELLAVFRDIASALRDVHAVSTDRIPQLSHGDLTLDNVMVTDANAAVVIDLGAARFGHDSSMSQDMFGKFGYFAPEQWLGMPGGPEADLWALGVCIVRAATGHMPFGAGPASAKRTVDEPPNVEGLPVPLSGVVHVCLRKNPEGRWPADRLLRRLEEELCGLETNPDRGRRIQTVTDLRFVSDSRGLIVREVRLKPTNEADAEDASPPEQWQSVKGSPNPGDYALTYRGKLISPKTFVSHLGQAALPASCPHCLSVLLPLDGNWRNAGHERDSSVSLYCPNRDCPPQRMGLLRRAADWTEVTQQRRPIRGNWFDVEPLLIAMHAEGEGVLEFLGLNRQNIENYMHVTNDEWTFLHSRRRNKMLVARMAGLASFLRIFGCTARVFDARLGKLTPSALALRQDLPLQLAGLSDAETHRSWWAERGDLVRQAALTVNGWLDNF
jgi:serine/threonine protein kinase